MHFDRFGHTYQLSIRTPDDLRRAMDLDDALWMATSAPIASLTCEPEFLGFVDLDKNGVIRCDELRAAVQWLFERLSDTTGICAQAAELELAALNGSDPDGKRLAETALFVIRTLGLERDDRIALADLAAFRRNLDSHPINGDGVIPPGAAEDEEVRQFIRDILACSEGREDRTGRIGITEADLDLFVAAASGYLDWLATAARDDGDVLPLGDRTAEAHEALEAVRAKVDEFFARCEALGFLGTSEPPAAPGEAATPQDSTAGGAVQDALRRAPLAEPNVEAVLPLEGKLNPAYAAALREFRTLVVEAVMGPAQTLLRADWERLKAFFSSYEEWLSAKRGAEVEELGEETLRRYVGGRYAGVVRDLLASDLEVTGRLDAVRDLRKLLLYHKHLFQLANNFVSFPDLYDPGRRAMFERGSLVIDGRWFNFAVRVDDLKEHRDLARTSRMYVMYVELTRVNDSEKLLVAVPATSGTVGNLCVGKRGVFSDTAGLRYQARVVEIIENPVSFEEALLSPFARLGKFIAGKIEAMSSAAEKQLETQVGQATQQVQQGVQQTVQQAPELIEQRAQAAPAVAAAPQAASSRRDLLIGASISIAALSSAFAFITEKLAGVDAWKIGVAAGLLVLVVLLPTALVALLKLRRRDLSALLEGCGWAINGRMRLNRTQRKQFTRLEPYPADATGTPRRRWLGLFLVVLLALVAVVALRRCRPGGRGDGEGTGPPPAVQQEQPLDPAAEDQAIP